MKILLSSVLLCFILSPLSAQFGLNGRYVAALDSWTFERGPSELEQTDMYETGWSAGLDYWFRMKNVRIEFLPELNYTTLDNIFTNGARAEMQSYSFFLNTNFYLWDFYGDCDCPTFSKQGPTLQKGLFVQVSPGLSYWQSRYEPQTPSFQFENNDWVPSIGAGLGFDLGLSDLVTLTPMVGLRYHFSASLQGLQAQTANVDTGWILQNEKANPLLLSGGLRLGIRLDDNY